MRNADPVVLFTCICGALFGDPPLEIRGKSAWLESGTGSEGVRLAEFEEGREPRSCTCIVKGVAAMVNFEWATEEVRAGETDSWARRIDGQGLARINPSQQSQVPIQSKSEHLKPH